MKNRIIEVIRKMNRLTLFLVFVLSLFCSIFCSIALVDLFGIWGADCGDERWNESGSCYISVCHKSYPALLPRLLTGTFNAFGQQVILRVYHKNGSHLFSSSYLPFEGLDDLYEPARWWSGHVIHWHGPLGVELRSFNKCKE